MNRRHLLFPLIALAIAGGFNPSYAADCEDNPPKLTLSVSGAQPSNQQNYYVVEIPAQGTTTVTLTASGKTPCPDKCRCCTNTTCQEQDPEKDGDPIYTFIKPIGDQNPPNGPTIKIDVTSSTTPNEYKFKVTKIEQKYKACPSGWTGGSLSETNSQASEEVTLLIYKIETETVARAPADRTRRKIGVGEEVNIRVLPSSVSANWSVDGAQGSVAPASGPRTLYTAPPQAPAPPRIPQAIVRAEIKGVIDTISFDVIEPSGIIMEAVADLSTKNPLSAGFDGQAYILPADVNFYRIKVYEGECTAITTANEYFDRPPYKGAPHLKGPALPPSGYVVGKGTRDGALDAAWLAAVHLPYSNGTWEWPIPWFYILDNVDKKFTTVHQISQLTVDASGKATLTTSKGGASKMSTNP